MQGCCGTGFVETGILCALDDALACDDADKYVFFDAVHPSERAYKIIADAFINTTSPVFHWIKKYISLVILSERSN